MKTNMFGSIKAQHLWLYGMCSVKANFGPMNLVLRCMISQCLSYILLWWTAISISIFLFDSKYQYSTHCSVIYFQVVPMKQPETKVVSGCTTSQVTFHGGMFWDATIIEFDGTIIVWGRKNNFTIIITVCVTYLPKWMNNVFVIWGFIVFPSQTFIVNVFRQLLPCCCQHINVKYKLKNLFLWV